MTRNRPGVTLIEVSVALSILSIVWLCITTTLYTLHRADRRQRDELQGEQSLNRFALRLRSETHSAHAATLDVDDDGTERLTLSFFDERNVRYHFSNGAIHRTVTQNEATLSRDTFAINCVGVKWELVELDATMIAVARLSWNDPKSEAAQERAVKAALPWIERSIKREEEPSS